MAALRSAGHIASTCARADSIVTPGARRPMVAIHREVPWNIVASDCMIDGSSAIGTITSCSIVTLKPLKSFWTTPMIVSGTPSTLIVRPTTEGSPP